MGFTEERGEMVEKYVGEEGCLSRLTQLLPKKVYSVCLRNCDDFSHE